MRTEKLVFTGPGEVEIRSTAIDEDLGETGLLGETLYTLVSPGTELMSAETASPDSFPLSVGYATVDRVLDTGSEVESVEPGDEVFTRGDHAAHHRLDVAESPVVPVPEGVPTRLAPFARFCGVSTPSIQTAEVNPPALAAVFGLGLVGNLACQMLAAFGYDVVGLDPVDARRRTAEGCGVGTTLDPTVDLDARLPAAVDGSPGLVLECSGTAAALASAVEIADRDAEIVQIGAPWEETDPDVSAYDVQDALFFDYLTLRSGWEWQIPDFADDFDRYSHYENYAHALELIARGEVTVADLVTHLVSPSDAQSAYDGLAEQKETHLGVLLDWS